MRAASARRAARLWSGFWAWYERNYVLNVALASALFLLQIAHLTWLGADPIASRLTDHSLFSFHGLLQYLIWFVDYSEIPALIAVSLVYVNELRRAGGSVPGLPQRAVAPHLLYHRRIRRRRARRRLGQRPPGLARLDRDPDRLPRAAGDLRHAQALRHRGARAAAPARRD